MGLWALQPWGLGEIYSTKQEFLPVKKDLNLIRKCLVTRIPMFPFFLTQGYILLGQTTHWIENIQNFVLHSLPSISRTSNFAN